MAKLIRHIPVEDDESAGRMNLSTGLNRTDDEVTIYRKAKNLAVISKTTAVTLGGGVASDTVLDSIIVLDTLVGTCVVTGFADSDGAAQSFTLPAGTTARSIDFQTALNVAGALTVTCSNAADDNKVLVAWRAA